MEDPGGVEPLGARIKSPLPNRLRLERSGSIGDGDTAASRPGFVMVMVMLVSCCWFSRTVTIHGLPVIGRVLCLRATGELTGVSSRARTADPLHVGQVLNPLSHEAVGARSRTRTRECRCVGPMPW